MKNVAFGMCFIGALLAALAMLLPFAMNECQLSPTKQLIDECFSRNAIGGKIYICTLAALAVASLLLRDRGQKRWSWATVIAIPVLPLISTIAAIKLIVA